jgi:biopolymer transport protein ExbD
MRADPNVTPMIDVLMVLLIIFMVIVPIGRRAVDVVLPAPAGDAGGAAIVLEVGPDGRLAVNQQPVAEAELGARLRAIYAGRPDRTIVVRGDGAARYQDVVAAIDSARGAGVRVVGLDPRPAPPPAQ